MDHCKKSVPEVFVDLAASTCRLCVRKIAVIQFTHTSSDPYTIQMLYD
eukprot:COSAG02_NODE_89_length_38500_cov_61.646910_19_plen_48_part_00